MRDLNVGAGGNVATYRSPWLLPSAFQGCEGRVFTEADVAESTGKVRWRVFVAAAGALSKWDGWRGQAAQRQMLSGTLYCDDTRQYEAARTNAREIHYLTITAACTAYGLQIYLPQVAVSVWCPRRPPPFMDTLG